MLNERNLGDPSAAIASYRAAIVARPRHAAAWVALGSLHARQGQISEGLRCLERAVSVDPRSEVTWHALGTLHLRIAVGAREGCGTGAGSGGVGGGGGGGGDGGRAASAGNGADDDTCDADAEGIDGGSAQALVSLELATQCAPPARRETPAALRPLPGRRPAARLIRDHRRVPKTHRAPHLPSATPRRALP